MIQVNNIIWDCSNLIDANDKWVAFAWAAGGGGRLVIKNSQKPEKSNPNPPAICGMHHLA